MSYVRKELKKPISFSTNLLGKDIVVTVTDKTISFRQKGSKQNICIKWYDDIIARSYKI